MRKTILNWIIRFGAVFSFLMFTPAWAQTSVVQSGSVTQFHVPCWVTNGVIKDCGSAVNSTATEFGVTKNGGVPFTVNSAISSSPYTRLYMSSTTSSGGTIGLTSGGGATNGTLTLDINGTNVVMPAAPGGTVLPTVNTDTALANNAPACFKGTDGTLKNCGGTPGSGTVTEVDTGTGLTGGPITTTGTIRLAAIANATLLGNSSGSSAAPTAQSVSGNFALIGGTLSLASIASGSVLGNATGLSAEPVGTTLSSMIDTAIGSTRGSILYRGGSGWAAATPGTSGYAWVSNGAGADPSYQAVTAAMPGYIYGVTLSNDGSDATNDIDIAAGRAADNTSGTVMALGSALVKQTDAAWAVGTNQGCLDTGAVGNNTYHIFLIERSDTGVVDVLCSLSASSPTMPTNYDLKRRIGSIIRSGGTILAFSQKGNEFLLSSPVLDVNSNNPGTSAVTRTLTVPTGIVINALVNWGVINASSSITVSAYISSLDTTDLAPSLTAAPLGQLPGTNNGSGNSQYAAGQISTRTNTSAQVRSRLLDSSASVTLRGATLGWIDTRGQYATP